MGILRTDKISGLETPTAVTGSVSFDGDSDSLTVPASVDFTLDGQFTVEFWIYLNTIVLDTQHPSPITFSQSGGTNSGQIYLNTNNNFLSLWNGSSNVVTTGNGSITTGRWYHVAATRDSSDDCRIFLDGVLKQTASSTHTFGNASGDLRIGSYNGTGGDVDGYISNLRILKGTALYTSDFTPTHELEVIGDTVLLCCNNPDSVTAVSYAGIGTSRTITANGNVSVASTVPGLTRDFTFGTQFEGVTRFDTQGYFVPPSGTTEQRGRGRGLFGGGDPGVNTINYITIASMGNAQDFGDLSQTRLGPGSVASSTRAVFMTGYSGSNVNTMDFVTIATTGNAVDFGNLADDDRHETAGVSNQTRGMVGGGQGTSAISDRIDYITIASTGDSIDFGNLTLARRNATGVMSSTRGVFCGGRDNTPAPSTQQEELDYVTISSTGNALDFGDLTVARGRMGSVCSSTRGVIGGGEGSPADSNVIDYITIASTGNAQDFGDMITASEGDNGGCSNSMRGVFGGHDVPAGRNILEYVTISSTGNSQDFGDLTYSATRRTGCSDSHGGIS